MRDSINMDEFVNITNKYIKNSDINIIMEIGSLDGGDAVFLKRKYPHASVYAIEGLPDNYQSMKVLSTITAIQSIVCDYDGYIQFNKKNINGIHGIYDRGSEYGTNVIVEPCCRLDTLCLKHNIPYIDLLKIDVEGATYDVIKGMGNLFTKIKCMHIETENYPFFIGQKLHSDVVSLLNDTFNMVKMTSVGIGMGYQHDSVWVNKNYNENI